MRLVELQESKGILILGAGREGLSAFRFLRDRFPEKRIGLADQKEIHQLDSEIRKASESDPNVQLLFGQVGQADLDGYETFVKSPGIPQSWVDEVRDGKDFKGVTTPTAIFFANCEGDIVGVTGTKGKSTTAALVHSILQKAGRETFLIGNIGFPALDYLQYAGPQACFVYELSSQQLEDLNQSPRVAVLLNIIEEHLDYHGDFRRYARAKENITRYQSDNDYLVYNTASQIAREIAGRSAAHRIPFSLDRPVYPGCFVSDGHAVCAMEQAEGERVIRIEDVPLLGHFNINNVLAAVAVGRILGIESETIALAIRSFKPLEHRFELIGTFKGITFYNASIATVPEATIQHLNTLGDDVQTLMLGGYDRRLDFTNLANRILSSHVKTLILFPTTGRKIWETVLSKRPGANRLPKAVFIKEMEEAVRFAYQLTDPGKICLHSPASPSFGIFKDYVERGMLFKQLVTQLGVSGGEVRDE